MWRSSSCFCRFCWRASRSLSVIWGLFLVEGGLTATTYARHNSCNINQTQEWKFQTFLLFESFFALTSFDGEALAFSSKIIKAVSKMFRQSWLSKVTVSRQLITRQQHGLFQNNTEFWSMQNFTLIGRFQLHFNSRFRRWRSGNVWKPLLTYKWQRLKVTFQIEFKISRRICRAIDLVYK